MHRDLELQLQLFGNPLQQMRILIVTCDCQGHYRPMRYLILKKTKSQQTEPDERKHHAVSSNMAEQAALESTIDVIKNMQPVCEHMYRLER